MKDRYDYYYGQEAEQFSFYRIPKVLFTNEKFAKLSCEAKVLYGLMLDRMSLSMKNQWLDKENRVFIYFTLEDVMKYLNCGHDKGVKLLAELDKATGIGLIERRKQGMGKPNIIYVMNYISEEDTAQECESSDTMQVQEDAPEQFETSENQKLQVLKNGSNDFGKSKAETSENQKSRVRKTRSNDFGKTDSNYTNINNTNYNYTEYQSIYPSISAITQDRKIDRLDKIAQYRNIIAENISYEALCHDYSKEEASEILELMTDTVCSSQKTIWISGQEWPLEVVRSRFLKLDMMHIQYVFDCLNQNTTKVHNIRAYLLAMLFNAPTTIGSYYKARVNNDLYGK